MVKYTIFYVFLGRRQIRNGSVEFISGEMELPRYREIFFKMLRPSEVTYMQVRVFAIFMLAITYFNA